MSTTAKPRGNPGLYRLLAWLSPGFPIGAFSYSHGLEAVAADGAAPDRAGLESWVAAIIEHGSGRIDADILCAAHRAAAAGDSAALGLANERGVAFRATAELALEAAQQGAAFLATCRAAWPDPFFEAWANQEFASPLNGGEGVQRASVCHAAAFGAIAARAGIRLDDALLGYLQAFTANLVSAGLRLGVIGQMAGQRILAALEPVIAAAAAAAMARDLTDFGAATFAADLASTAHETQYTRLFRS